MLRCVYGSSRRRKVHEKVDPIVLLPGHICGRNRRPGKSRLRHDQRRGPQRSQEPDRRGGHLPGRSVYQMVQRVREAHGRPSQLPADRLRRRHQEHQRSDGRLRRLGRPHDRRSARRRQGREDLPYTYRDGSRGADLQHPRARQGRRCALPPIPSPPSTSATSSSGTTKSSSPTIRSSKASTSTSSSSTARTDRGPRTSGPATSRR